MTTTTSRPCTCASQTGAEGSIAPTRRRFSPIAPARSAADGEAGPRSSVAVAPVLVPPLRVVKNARTRAGPCHAGTIQSSPRALSRSASASLIAAQVRLRRRAAPRSAPRGRPARGDSHCIGARVTGCTSPRRRACSAWRGNENAAAGSGRPGLRRPRYVGSPSSGCPSAVRCTRIWCVRPVSRRHCTSVAAPKRSRTSTCVRAGLPAVTTAISVRCVGWRPIGASIVVARARSPKTTATYSRLTRARRQLPDEVDLRGLRLRDDDEPARVLVEAVHDARARQRGQRGRVMQQRVLQRAVAVAGARMHDEAGGLVEDEERVVLVDDRERDRLCGHAGVRRAPALR